MVDVFISYQRAERDAVQIIANKLAELGVEVWFDGKLRVGGSYDEEIAKALDASKCVLVCWTPSSIASQWVRAEATAGNNAQKLAACFLEPTQLISPFTIINAADLCRWAGQDDDADWLKTLDAIGTLIGRPGLSTYMAAMRPGAPAKEMRAWAETYADDKLAESVWERLKAQEDESGGERLKRQKREARARAEKRRSQEARSRQLARERGIRDPKRERRRQLALIGVMSVMAVVMIAGADWLYRLIDLQGRQTTTEVRAFINEIKVPFHPAVYQAKAKLADLDGALWRAASASPSIDSLENYIKDAETEPKGKYVAEAKEALATPLRLRDIQKKLRRLQLYDGPLDGAYDEGTIKAIEQIELKYLLPMAGRAGAVEERAIEKELDEWIHPRLEELVAQDLSVSNEAYLRTAADLGLDAATVLAVIDVEVGLNRRGFDTAGRPLILFEPHLFSRFTQHRYDDDPRYSDISYERWDGRKYPRNADGRWAALAKAYALDPDAALQATSWGRYQVLGFQYQKAGFETVGEFVRSVSTSESAQLRGSFVALIRSLDLIDELKERDWAGFARVYNGNGYAANQYDVKLRAAYERHEARIREAVAARRTFNATDEAVPSAAPPPPPPAP